MLYQAYDAQSDMFSPVRQMARLALSSFGQEQPTKNWFGANHAVAAYELIDRAGLTHARPSFNIAQVRVGNREVAVTEEVALKLPFGTLLHFKKDIGVVQPSVLVVAPLSGHFATLLRNTALTLLADHDVYITDWHNARDVPLERGPFGFDDYVTYLIRFMEQIGTDCHVVSVCQPCVQTLAAVAVMAEGRNACQPRSMTLMAGPVDTRINPTEVNKLASGKPISWFKSNLIAQVPRRYPGAGRKVYPGFIQLSAFMSMNMQRHIKAHKDLYNHIVKGEIDKATAIKTFYDEYFAVLDLPAE
ncbi:MAG: polyhydroxyalkanoate depolymerase, partial [Hyphomicrobiaceae bacterium]